MRRFLLLALCVLAATAELRAAEAAPQRDTIYILGVGNSWTRDSMRWLSAIAKSANRPVVVGHAYLGGSTLEQQYRGIDDTTFTYCHRDVDQAVHSTYQYWKYDCSEDPTKNPSRGYRNGLAGIGVTLESVVTDKPWDYVVLQPEITVRRYIKELGGKFDLNLLIERIKRMMRPEIAAKVRCGLMIPFSYPAGNTDYRKHLYEWYNDGIRPATQQEWDNLYEKVHKAIQKEIYMLGSSLGSNCEFYVNVGQAIYNGRQNKHLVKSGYKLQRSQSNTHLSEGLAMYIASLAYAYELLGISRDEATFYPKYSKDVQLTGDRGTTDLITVENTEFLARQARIEAWKAHQKR